MRKLINLIMLAIYFFYGSIEVAFAELTNDDLRNIRLELNEIPLIRIGISDAPNNGHQSAGASVVSRLREIGYNGEIQIVYDDNKTSEKLIYLIPPFQGDKNGELQVYTQEKLSFLSLKHLKDKQYPEVPLVIMGADDHHRSNSDYHAKTLLKLQPMDWHETPELIYDVVDEGIFEEPLNELKSKGFVYTIPSPIEIDKFLTAQLNHQKYADRLPFFTALFQPDQKTDILPVYGHGVRKNNHQLITLLNGLVKAKVRDHSIFTNGIVIPVFNNINGEGLNLLNNYINFQKDTVQNNDIQIETFDVAEPALMEAIRTVNHKKIIVVRVGAVPKPLFEYTYKRATLPGVVEGLNSINYMSNLGTPYLPSSKIEGYHFFQRNSGRGVFFKSKFNVNHREVVPIIEKAWIQLSNSDPEHFEGIAEFYLLAASKLKEVQDFFVQFKSGDLNDDQVGLGLKEYFIRKNRARNSFFRRMGIDINEYYQKKANKACLRHF